MQKQRFVSARAATPAQAQPAGDPKRHPQGAMLKVALKWTFSKNREAWFASIPLAQLGPKAQAAYRTWWEAQQEVDRVHKQAFYDLLEAGLGARMNATLRSPDNPKCEIGITLATGSAERQQAQAAKLETIGE